MYPRGVFPPDQGDNVFMLISNVLQCAAPQELMLLGLPKAAQGALGRNLRVPTVLGRSGGKGSCDVPGEDSLLMGREFTQEATSLGSMRGRGMT